MRDPRRYLLMLVGTATTAVLGTALVAIDPAGWGRVVGFAILLAGAITLFVELLTVTLARNRQRRYAAAVDALQTALDDTAGLENVLERGVVTVVQLLGAQAGLAVMRDDPDTDFDFYAAWGFGRDVLEDRPGDLMGIDVLTTLVAGRHPAYVDLQEPRFRQSSLRRTGMRWVWVAPFRAGQIDGAIIAASMSGAPAHHVTAVLATIVDVLGRAAEHASLISRERGRARLLTHLADFGNFAVASFEEDHLRKAAAVAATAMFPRSSGYITALEPGSGALKVADVFGVHSEKERLAPLLGSTECDAQAGCRAISRGGAYEGVGNQGLWDCPHRRSGESARTFVCTPITSSDGPLGAIHVTRSSDAGFESEEKEILEALGIQLGLAIANGNLLAVTRDQALRDSMTGLHNYRFLIEYLDNQAAFVERTNGRMSVLMIDIDHFRDFNNKFGHAAGDHVLRAVARAFRKRIRRSDLAARYGGEEFTVVLPGTTVGGAEQLAETVRHDIEHQQLHFDGRDLGEINVSIGVATMPDHAGTVESLLKAADEALYAAKSAGRNRVMAAGNRIPPGADDAEYRHQPA